MEVHTQRLGPVRRWHWQAPFSCPGGHIEGCLRDQRLHQQWAIPFYQRRLEGEDVLKGTLQAKARIAEDIRGIGR